MDVKSILSNYCSQHTTAITNEIVNNWLTKYPINVESNEEYVTNESWLMYNSFTIIDRDNSIVYNHGWVHCSGAFIYWFPRKKEHPLPQGDRFAKALSAPKVDPEYAVIPLPIELVKLNYPNKTAVELDQMLTGWCELCNQLGYPMYYVGAGVVQRTSLPTLSSKGAPCFLFLLKRDEFVSPAHAVGAMQLARFAYITDVFPVIEKALELVKICSAHKAFYYGMYFVNKANGRLASFGNNKYIGFPYPKTKKDLRDWFSSDQAAYNTTVWGMLNAGRVSGMDCSFRGYGVLNYANEMTNFSRYAEITTSLVASKRVTKLKEYVDNKNIEAADNLYHEEIKIFQGMLGHDSIDAYLRDELGIEDVRATPLNVNLTK